LPTRRVLLNLINDPRLAAGRGATIGCRRRSADFSRVGDFALVFMTTLGPIVLLIALFGAGTLAQILRNTPGRGRLTIKSSRAIASLGSGTPRYHQFLARLLIHTYGVTDVPAPPIPRGRSCAFEDGSLHRQGRREDQRRDIRLLGRRRSGRRFTVMSTDPHSLGRVRRAVVEPKEMAEMAYAQGNQIRAIR